MEMVAVHDHSSRKLAPNVAAAVNGERRGPGGPAREARSINQMTSTAQKSGQSEICHDPSVPGSTIEPADFTAGYSNSLAHTQASA
jgi:hypothetical protein